MRTKILLGMATIVLAGCGTIANGGSQTVDVVVKGSPSAFCDIKTSVFRNSGTFPNKVALERSREPLQLECRGEQNLYKKFEVKPTAQPAATAGNVANGTTFLGLSYDMLSGGAWAYPDPLIVDFRSVASAPKAGNWPENTADGTPAAIEAPTPVRMTPVVDEQLNPALGQRASAKPQVIDAVQIASENAKPASKSAAKMDPIVSPEDDPAVQKAKAAEKAKAVAAAKKKAEAKKKAAAAAKKKAAEEAAKKKAAAEEAEAKPAEAETLPEAKEEAPAAEPAAAAPAPAASPAVAPAVPLATPPVPAAPTPPSPATVPAAPKPQENAAPAAKTEAGAESVDVDKYLTGDGQ